MSAVRVCLVGDLHRNGFRKLDFIRIWRAYEVGWDVLLYPLPCLPRTVWQHHLAMITPLQVGSMQSYFREILRFIDRLGPTEWVLVLGVVIVIGLVCMKGFGSRSNY